MGSKIVQTNYAVAPGEFIAEWLEDNSISLPEMAERMDIDQNALVALISGTMDLTDSIASKLETVTRIKARIWISYETTYRADKNRLTI